MDDALQQAYRQALTEPDDPAARRAYAHALVRAGRRDGAALLRDVPPCSTCAFQMSAGRRASTLPIANGIAWQANTTGHWFASASMAKPIQRTKAAVALR